MPCLSRALLVASLLVLAVPVPADAAEVSNTEFLIVRPDDVVEDDLYAGAIKVTVDGRIEGDLIAFAAERVEINGTVTGSVLAVAPEVVINGTVGGSVRSSGSSLTVDGHVGRDVVTAVFDLVLGADASVGGDVVVWALDASALGAIGRDLTGSQRALSLAGLVGADVDVSVGRLTVVDDLVVEGDLGYRSVKDAEGLENAVVGGTIVHKDPLPANVRVRALRLFGRFLVVVFLTLIATAVAWGWPSRTSKAVSVARSRMFKSWGAGALVMLAPLFMAGITAVVLRLAPSSASFPLLVILVPLIVAATGAVGTLSLVAGIPTAGLIGQVLLGRLGLYGSILLGSAIIGVLWLVPIFGWLIPVLVLPLGLGSWMLSWGEPPAGEGSLDTTETAGTKA